MVIGPILNLKQILLQHVKYICKFSLRDFSANKKTTNIKTNESDQKN